VLPELVSLQRSLGIQSSRAPMASVTREAGIALCGHETDPMPFSHCCGNTDRLFVVVLSDTVAGVLDLDTTESVDRRLGETIDGPFSFIQSAIDRPAQLIRAQYDVAKGFPTEIDYDGAAQIADDEISFRISDVHPIR